MSALPPIHDSLSTEERLRIVLQTPREPVRLPVFSPSKRPPTPPPWIHNPRSKERLPEIENLQAQRLAPKPKPPENTLRQRQFRVLTDKSTPQPQASLNSRQPNSPQSAPILERLPPAVRNPSKLLPPLKLPTSE